MVMDRLIPAKIYGKPQELRQKWAKGSTAGFELTQAYRGAFWLTQAYRQAFLSLHRMTGRHFGSGGLTLPLLQPFRTQHEFGAEG